MNELIDIVTLDGIPTGVAVPKSEIHSKGHLHNTAHVWLYNAKGEILLQQRSSKKLICPLLWDVSVAGHVDSGETPEEAAIREAKEEIGIHLQIDNLIKIGVFKCFQSYSNGINDNELHNTFISEIKSLVTDLEPHPDEVEALKFVSIREFESLLESSKSNNHFIDSNREYYLKVLEAITHELNLQ